MGPQNNRTLNRFDRPKSAENVLTIVGILRSLGKLQISSGKESEIRITSL